MSNNLSDTFYIKHWSSGKYVHRLGKVTGPGGLGELYFGKLSSRYGGFDDWRLLVLCSGVSSTCQFRFKWVEDTFGHIVCG